MQDTKIDGFTFNTEHVKGMKDFDKFYTTYKDVAFLNTEKPEQMTDEMRTLQRGKLQKAWDYFHPAKAVEEKKK